MGNLTVKFDYPHGVRTKIKEWVIDNPFLESFVYSLAIESKIDTMFASPEIEGLADKFKGNFEELRELTHSKSYSHSVATEVGIDVILYPNGDGIDYSPLRSVNELRFFDNQADLVKWSKGKGKHCSRFVLICSSKHIREYGVISSVENETIDEAIKANGLMFDYITSKKSQWALLGFNVNGNEGAINNSVSVVTRLIIRIMSARQKVRGRDAGKIIAPIK